MFSESVIPLVVQRMQPECIHRALIGLQRTNIRNLLIQSCGGLSVNLLWAIDHLINADLCTIGGSTVNSLAVPVFLCGRRRVALSDAKFFIQRAGFMYDGERVTSGFAQMKSFIYQDTDDYERFDFWQTQHYLLEMLDKKMIEIIASRTHLSIDMTAKFLIEEKTFTTREAIECGIVHEIIPCEQINILSKHGIYEPWSE